MSQWIQAVLNAGTVISTMYFQAGKLCVKVGGAEPFRAPLTSGDRHTLLSAEATAARRLEIARTNAGNLVRFTHGKSRVTQSG